MDIFRTGGGRGSQPYSIAFGGVFPPLLAWFQYDWSNPPHIRESQNMSEIFLLGQFEDGDRVQQIF